MNAAHCREHSYGVRMNAAHSRKYFFITNYYKLLQK
jgi:hypothetical protein